MDMELTRFHERPDWLSSVAFWYQFPPATFDAELPSPEERVAPYRIIDPNDLVRRADPPFLVLPSDTGVMYAPNTPKASIEFDIEIEQPGRYNLSGVFYFAVIAGVYQITLDGEKIGAPVDFFAVGYDPRFLSLDTHDLEPGTHTLRFESTGTRSPGRRAILPDMNGIGLVRLLLLRLEDMDGYHEVRDALLEKR